MKMNDKRLSRNLRRLCSCSSRIADTLLRLAETPRLYVPKWSEEILAEVERTLVRKLGKTKEQAAYLIGQLTCAFPESVVKECQSIEAALNNHEKDRHVLAAAIGCSAQTIVTFNLKHFPADILKQYDVEPLHPDEFLVNQFYLDDALVTKRFTEQATAINRNVEDHWQLSVKRECSHYSRKLWQKLLG